MPHDDAESRQLPDADLIDSLPLVGRATTQLERSFGPSCLLSLVIVLLLVVLLKRYLQLPWLMLIVLTAIIWLLVLTLLVRWRPDEVVDDE
ncbi:MAG: hypothetical protein ACRDJH_13715 [Thermomicrobiales bacterium]